ncbi:MAG: hypothetical protein AMS21_00895 [Gemmatimonas sp. SG8_38_2]|nr:MAG: hypothetical protein AMS21_00895 [Gemmatimonas sp. SG8_38_2]
MIELIGVVVVGGMMLKGFLAVARGVFDAIKREREQPERVERQRSMVILAALAIVMYFLTRRK